MQEPNLHIDPSCYASAIDPLWHVSPCPRNTSPEVAQYDHERSVYDLNARMDALWKQRDEAEKRP